MSRNKWVDFQLFLDPLRTNFYYVRAFMLQLPYTFFFKNSVWVLLFFWRLEAEIFIWLLLDYREDYSLLFHQFTFHVLRYRWVQFYQISYSMRSDLWEYSWKLQLLLSERIQPCKWFSLWRYCNDFADVSADDINWSLNIKNMVECCNKN